MNDEAEEEEVRTAHGLKPRRLAETNVTYIVQLATQLATSSSSSSSRGAEQAGETEEEREDREVMVRNVLAELAQCTASAACDKRTSDVIERLAYMTTLPQLCELMRRFAPYSIFLARQRHSSHVYQAICSRCCFLLKNSGIPHQPASGDQPAFDEDALETSVAELASPVLREISWLCKETSASHVVRSLLCLLAGMPCISERKGKESKHQHSVSLSEPIETLLEPKRFTVAPAVLFYVPAEFKEMAGGAVAALVELGGPCLQDLSADTSSCTVLTLAVRIMYTPDLIEGGPSLADRLVRSCLQWEEATAGEAAAEGPVAGSGPTVFYGMAADRSASHFLEACLECCGAGEPALGGGGAGASDASGSSGEGLFVELVRGAVQGRAGEYAKDGMGNFVLQAALRRMACELERRGGGFGGGGGGGGGVGKKGRKQSPLAAGCAALLQELTAGELFGELVATRGGVVLWMLEAAGPCGWGERIGGLLLRVWCGLGGGAEAGAAVALPTSAAVDAAVARRLAPPEGSAAASAKRTPGRGKHDSAEGRDPAQLLACRLVGAALRLPVGAVSSALLGSVSRLPPSTLHAICLSGPMSRAVMDSFFAACPAHADGGAAETLRLLTALQTHLCALAAHFIGHHLIRQAFAAASAAGKEVLVRALDAGRDGLSSSKEGRRSLQVCHQELWHRAPHEWVQLVARQGRARDMVAELMGGAGAGGGGGGGGGGAKSGDGEGREGGEGKKRKRKRQSKKWAEGEGEGAAEGGGDED